MIYLDEHPERIDVASALERVSRQRREHAMRYRQEHDRKLSLAAYLLLQRALLEEYGINEAPEFSFSPEGKPFLKDYPHIHFSLSHCNEAVACIVDNRPVGIDIESISSYSPELIDACMNTEEKQTIFKSANPALTFIRLWTQKESLIKLTGQGLSDNIKDILSNVKYIITTYENVESGFIYSVCETTEIRR